MSHPTYSIQSFQFRNFKGIKDLEVTNLPEGAPWIFITGENGYGKTSVLQALASALVGTGDNLYKYFMRNDGVKLRANLHGENNEYRIESDGRYSPYNNERNFNKIACYGSSRLNTYTESSKGSGIKESLFNTQTLLENIEYQFTRWYAKKDDDQEFKEKYESTKKLLIKLLEIKDIEIDYKTDEVFYIEEDASGEIYERLPLLQLAAGYRSLVSMVGDMILRLFHTQSTIHDPSKLEGIVIIDELDLHFHPKWQRRLPTILSEFFPKIQFVASTHSPIPLLGAPKKSVFLTVTRTKETGILVERSIHLEKEVSKLTPNLLLDSFLFGQTDLSSVTLRANQHIETADTFNERDYRKKLEKQMEEELSPEERAELKRLLASN